MMELRSCSNLHFIQAAKDGLLVKTLNVTRGRPMLKFKKLTDIYEALGVNNQDHFLRPKDEFETLVFDSTRVKVESPSLSTSGKEIIKSDPQASEFSCSGGGDSGRNSVMDDLGFGDVTLKQLKERCKAKKRKHSKCVDLSRETDIMCSGVKQEYPNIEIGEDERDLMEPLSSWKSRLAENKKSKSKCLKKRVSAPRSALSICKSEDIPSHQDFLQYKGDLPAPIDIKKEVPELDCSDYENSSSLIFDNHVGFCGIVPKEVHEISAEFVLGTQAEDPQICVLNEAYYECMDNCNTESVQTVSASCGDIKKVDNPEIISHNLSVPETKGEDYVIHPISDGFFQDPISSTSDHSFGTHDGYQIFSTNHEMQCRIDSECIIQVPDMVTYNFDQFMEPSRSDTCPHEDDSRDYLPSNLETNTLHSSVGNCCLGSNRCMVSSTGDSPVAEEKESQRSDCGNAERNFSEILHPEASEEFTTTVDVGFDHYSEMDRPPERLFPTRKAISPASQEKLCKALESVKLHDEEHHGGKKKLCFAKETENKTKIHRTEEPDQVRRIRFSIKPKHIVNPKNEKRGSRPKDIPKVPNLSPAAPRFSTECTSIQSCSQSAIAFSERQMHDIECLATRLTNELKAMKEIAEERLWSESYPATSLKYNANEVRMAIKSATKVEQTAQRWLSMMARDCSRFCKIMRLTEKGSDAPKSVVIKERKKITFADEAGEKLCHVKIFENDLTSWLESDGENLEVLV